MFTSAALDDAGNPLFENLNTVTFVERGGKTTITLHARVIKSTDKALTYLTGMELGWETDPETPRGPCDGSFKRREIMTNTKASPAENLADREIVITRVFDAPRELIWNAWTDPNKLCDGGGRGLHDHDS